MITPAKSEAQVRGVYPLGMSATNSGVMPDAGFTYSNLFIGYFRNELKDPDGEVQATGTNSVLMDMNTFVWASKRQIPGGGRFSIAVTLPIANNSLTSDTLGGISGGGGFADSFYQPFIVGWEKSRIDFRLFYGFLAPTGSFNFEASDNVGSGYWTHVLAAGQTIYLTENKRMAISAFQMYEFHSTQEDTEIQPGQTMNLDYSLTHIVPLHNGMNLQFGVIGYEQWQTTDKTGPTITPEQSVAHYRVNALGFASNLMLPQRGVTIGFKYFKEFSNKSTLQGNSIQISASIGF